MGCADRSAYDLTQHAKATGIRLGAEKKLSEPRTIDVVEAVPNKAVIGKTFGNSAKRIFNGLAQLEICDVEQLEERMAEEG